MADPILIFPRVIYKDIDPSNSDNVTKGYIDGNIWINQSTGKTFICIDSTNGGWVTILTSGGTGAGGDFAFGDGTSSNVKFDLGDGIFEVDASNISIDEEGDLALAGDQIMLNKNRLPIDTAEIVAADEVEDSDGIIQFDYRKDEWQAGERGNVNPVVTSKLETRDPLPEDNWSTGHYLGMTWINKVTRQKFTCVSCPQDESLAVWVLALSQAPLTYSIKEDDHLILYNEGSNSYSKIKYSSFLQYIAYDLGGDVNSIPNYGFMEDESSNLTPSMEPVVTIGLLEVDVDNNMTPLESPEDPGDDVFFELDANDDVMPMVLTSPV